MLGGVSGVTRDVIPFGFAIGPIAAHLVGLNVVGLKRRGYSRDDIHRIRRAYRRCSSDEGTFARARRATPRRNSPAIRWSERSLDFIREAARPLMMARAGEGRAQATRHERATARRGSERRPARDHLRRRQPAVRGRRRGAAARPPRGAVRAARLGRPGSRRGLSAPLDRLGQFGHACRHAKAEGCRDIVLDRHRGAAAASDMRLDLRRRCGCCRASSGRSAAATTTCCRASGGVRGAWLSRARRPRSRAGDPDAARAHRAARQPSERDRADIARGLALLRAIGPFDVGQAVVVSDNHVLAVEAAEGTDRMLARLAELRGKRRASARRQAAACWSRRRSRPGPSHRPAVDRPAHRRRRGRARVSPASRSWPAAPIVAEPDAHRGRGRPRRPLRRRRVRRWAGHDMTGRRRTGRYARSSWSRSRNPATGSARALMRALRQRLAAGVQFSGVGGRA